MKKARVEKHIDQEFYKLSKNKFLSPESCTQLDQTRAFIFELNNIIKDFDSKFKYVPISARLLFYKYNLRQELILFKQYKNNISNN